MKIGLIDIEPKIFNTAYMLISQYHKAQGDDVEWWSPLTDNQFDKVYCSSLFDFTDKSEVPKRAICGGTGFNVVKGLPAGIDMCQYDYSIYPKCITSYVWFSRGCNRNCPWCVVPRKEGNFHLVHRKELNPRGRYVTIMDNDFFSNPDWENVISWIGEMPVDIQGIDVRKMTYAKAEALAGLRRWKNKRFKVAWDRPEDESKVLDGLVMLTENMPADNILCYVLIGFYDTPKEDLYRVETLRKLGINPFVMPYNKNDPYERAFARWVNNKAIFKKVKWENYQRSKP